MSRRSNVLVSRTMYQIAVMTFITAILWTLFSVISAINKAPEKVEVDKKLLTPITPTIDKATLELVKSRKQVDLNFAPVTINVIEASPSASIDTGDEQ